MKMSNKMYDTLKWIVMLVLPGLGSLYFGLSEIWSLPYGEQVVGTITVLTAFLSSILKISNVKYKRDLEDSETEEFAEEN